MMVLGVSGEGFLGSGDAEMRHSVRLSFLGFGEGEAELSNSRLDVVWHAVTPDQPNHFQGDSMLARASPPWALRCNIFALGGAGIEQAPGMATLRRAFVLRSFRTSRRPQTGAGQEPAHNLEYPAFAYPEVRHIPQLKHDCFVKRWLKGGPRELARPSGCVPAAGRWTY